MEMIFQNIKKQETLTNGKTMMDGDETASEDQITTEKNKTSQFEEFS